jgi:hypothetical protein
MEKTGMIVMPAGSSGWFFHSLALMTGRLGHLYSPRDQRGPWPWFPYALDNGAFSCWNPDDNTFDTDKWKKNEIDWRALLFWAQAAPLKARWAIVPDRPGHSGDTFAKWYEFAGCVASTGIPLALAVQDGMTVEAVKQLDPAPAVICVGGTTDWKWGTVEMWAREFPRVHLLRCSSSKKLDYLESLGIESCDGTGWNRGDRHRRARGLEEWCKSKVRHWQSVPQHDLWPYVNRARRDPKEQEYFA